jgi:hypothetical protein
MINFNRQSIPGRGDESFQMTRLIYCWPNITSDIKFGKMAFDKMLVDKMLLYKMSSFQNVS